MQPIIPENISILEDFYLPRRILVGGDFDITDEFSPFRRNEVIVGT